MYIQRFAYLEDLIILPPGNSEAWKRTFCETREWTIDRDWMLLTDHLPNLLTIWQHQSNIHILENRSEVSSLRNPERSYQHFISQAALIASYSLVNSSIPICPIKAENPRARIAPECLFLFLIGSKEKHPSVNIPISMFCHRFTKMPFIPNWAVLRCINN